MKVNPVKIAVLPVAGLGTRVMPLTLHQPKAMIGIVDRPMVHYVIDEIVAAGIRHIIIVTKPNQPEFKKYLDFIKADPEWRKSKVKIDLAVQKNPWGNGDAVFAARKYLKRRPFLVCFSDDLLVEKKPPMKTLIDLFNKTGSPTLALESVPIKSVSRYGVVAYPKWAESHACRQAGKALIPITDVVEKPTPSEAPSNLTIIGRYVLTPAILDEIGKLYPYHGKEIGLADALKNYIYEGGRIYGWHFKGKRFDAGSMIGLMQAQAYFGLHHKKLGKEFRKYLNESKYPSVKWQKSKAPTKRK